MMSSVPSFPPPIRAQYDRDSMSLKPLPAPITRLSPSLQILKIVLNNKQSTSIIINSFAAEIRPQIRNFEKWANQKPMNKSRIDELRRVQTARRKGRRELAEKRRKREAKAQEKELKEAQEKALQEAKDAAWREKLENTSNIGAGSTTEFMDVSIPPPKRLEQQKFTDTGRPARKAAPIHMPHDLTASQHRRRQPEIESLHTRKSTNSTSSKRNVNHEAESTPKHRPFLSKRLKPNEDDVEVLEVLTVDGKWTTMKDLHNYKPNERQIQLRQLEAREADDKDEAVDFLLGLDDKPRVYSQSSCRIHLKDL